MCARLPQSQLSFHANNSIHSEMASDCWLNGLAAIIHFHHLNYLLCTTNEFSLASEPICLPQIAPLSDLRLKHTKKKNNKTISKKKSVRPTIALIAVYFFNLHNGQRVETPLSSVAAKICELHRSKKWRQLKQSFWMVHVFDIKTFPLEIITYFSDINSFNLQFIGQTWNLH